MADARKITVYDGAAVVASGSSDAVDLGSDLHSLLRGVVNVVNVVGGPDLATFTLESSRDGLSGWKAAASYQANDVGEVEFTTDELRRWVRVTWELGSFTSLSFSMKGESHVLYATRRDLKLKALSDLVTDGSDAQSLAENLLSATSDAENALRPQYPLPVTTWPDSLKDRCASIAKYRFFNRDGFQPKGIDELIVKDYDDAQSWLRMVATRKIVLSGMTEPVVEPVRESFSRDCSDPPRRWGDDFGDW